MNNQNYAKYTEYFADWLAGGGVFPAAFEYDGIDPLPNLKVNFTAYYTDRELGLETEELFNFKFELYANIYISKYRQRAQELQQLYTQLTAPEKRHIKSGNFSRSYSPTVTKDFDLPVNIPDLTPADESEQFKNSTPQTASRTAEHTETETYNNVTDVDNGFTPSELSAQIKELEGKIYNIELELIKMFEPLFMQVF